VKARSVARALSIGFSSVFPVPRVDVAPALALDERTRQAGSAFPLRIPTRTAINEAREGGERKAEGLSSGNRRAAATPAGTKLVESASFEFLASSHVPRVTMYYVSYSSGEGNRRHGGA
jgi:hypothetical protein